MIIVRSDHFEKCHKKLPNHVQELFAEKIKLLVSSKLTHPSLRVKKMQGTKSIWEASITMNYRFTFELIEGGILLRRIGTHDILNNP